MTVREKDLVLTRIFNAPRERVWKAWTDPKQLALWWGRGGFTNPVCEVDLRPGGALRIGGWIYDTFGRYTWMYIGSAAIGLGAVAIVLAFPPFPRPAARLQPA